MKLFRIFLSAVALTLAIGGAFAANDLTAITNIGYTINSAVPHPTVQTNQCDKDLSTGVQCTVTVGSTTAAAYQKSSSIKLFRP